jgi:aerobic-type carbon monoxide dehydrogenase small subunit (CoxS/CutS family)
VFTGRGSAIGRVSMKSAIQFRLNGQSATLHADDDRMLLWALRTDLGLTGTKYGCGEGLCGACTVVVDGKAMRACSTPLKNVAGKDVVTIEGLSRAGRLHPLQQAFVDHGAFQCGYCTSGMLMSAIALLRETPAPSPETVAARMDRNLCRCGAHQRILAAIEAVATQTDKSS